MPFEGEERILPRHADAVVNDPDELLPARFDLHGDVPSPCIEGVFHQFLHHRGGTRHHFAGSDLVGYLLGQDSYGYGHRQTPPGDEAITIPYSLR
jgi:hypothetical protein